MLVVLGKSSNKVRFGACEGDDTSIGLLECAANATLRALASAAEHRVEFDLDLVRSLASPRCVVVTLSLSKPLGARKMQLCGCCLVNSDPLHAATKAVLQATNRLFETDFMHTAEEGVNQVVLDVREEQAQGAKQARKGRDDHL